MHLISWKQAMSGEAPLSQVVAASMRALTPLMFQEAIFMSGWRYRLSRHARTPGPASPARAQAWSGHSCRYPATSRSASGMDCRSLFPDLIRGSSPAMTLLVETLDRKAGAAAARGRHVGVVQLELGADQIVDEIELRAMHEAER